MSALQPEDLELLSRTGPAWEPLRGARIFVTGGTGFVGRWLVSSFAYANRVFRLGATIELLTRDPGRFLDACPAFAADEAVLLRQGDVRTVDLRGLHCTHIIHAATPSDADLNANHPGEMIEIIETGTKRLLDAAERGGASKYLLVSSGAVYRPPAPGGGFTEDSPFGPRWPEEPSAYHAGKRSAEALALEAARAGLPVTIARPFAFVGPHLPLDRHFAIGNFIADVLNGRPVRVSGDGTAVRSYLYAADLAIWLWAMLADERAAGQTYNVGSEVALTIAETAEIVAASVEPHAGVSVARHGTAAIPDVYFPCTASARLQLGLKQTVELAEAVRRTIRWHQS